MGVPQGSEVPTGTYALGALAGNPNLGEPAARPYAGPPTDPGAPMWVPPAAPGAPVSGAHHVRNGILAGVAAFALLAGGVAIGHAATNNSNLSSAPSSGSTRLPSGSGNGSGNPFGNGSPFGGAFGNGNSGNSGNGNSGNAATPARPAGRARATPARSRPRSTRASSTSTRRSATRSSRRPGPASCSAPTGWS